MLSLLFLAVEIMSAVLLIAPLHRLLEGTGFVAENYLSGMVIAFLPIAAGAAFHLWGKDKLLVPCSFALILCYTAAIIVLFLIRHEYEIVLSFLLPTLGVCSAMGNIIFWGIYTCRKKTKAQS